MEKREEKNKNFEEVLMRNICLPSVVCVTSVVTGAEASTFTSSTLSEALAANSSAKIEDFDCSHHRTRVQSNLFVQHHSSLLIQSQIERITFPNDCTIP